ncbi:MAG TPA: BPSS1780 family membrane protein [Burkholderiales bacterium]|nr:BPSS1780 family membrane protein [Burkholderiales bacterium]
MSQGNPYQPPRSQVADVSDAAPLGNFVEAGRGVDAGQGWAWIASGFGLFRKRAGVWIAVTIIAGVLVIVVSLFPIIGWLVNTLLMPVYLGGLLLGCKSLEDEGEFGVGQLFAGFSKHTGRLMAVGALSLAGWLLIMIPLFFIMGTSMFALMGGDPAAIAAAGPTLMLGVLVTIGLSVPLYMALWFAPCLILFNEAQPVQALGRSFRACSKNIIPFLLYGVLLFIVFVLATIPFGLGLLVAFPVLIASVYTSYRDIFYAPA